MTLQSRGNNGRWRLSLLAALASTLMLCWPAILNGGAFFFPDTGTYLREADAAVAEVTGWNSEWSDRRALYDAAGTARQNEKGGTPAASPQAVPLHPVLLGRSIYYGLLVFPFLTLIGSLGAVALQAGIATLSIWIALVALGTGRDRIALRLVAVSALLASLTSLPFVVSLIMPDMFAGIAVTVAVAAVVGWSRFARWERIALLGLLALSALVHSSHVLILLGMAGLTLLATLLTGLRGITAAIAMAAAALVGIAGEQAFSRAIAHRMGEAPIRPPFLTARLVNDGPGYAFLKQRCPGVNLEACRYLDRMPRDSDTFLWSQDRRDGVFSVENHAVQRRLAKQDFSFALQVVGSVPLAVIETSARSVLKQLRLTDLNIFNAENPKQAGPAFSSSLPGRYAQEVAASRYAERRMPVSFTRWANLMTALAAIIVLVSMLAAARRQPALAERHFAAGLVLAGLLLNAAVTGAMSKPHDRYNIRVIWTLQLVALGILCTRRDKYLVEQR